MPEARWPESSGQWPGEVPEGRSAGSQWPPMPAAEHAARKVGRLRKIDLFQSCGHCCARPTGEGSVQPHPCWRVAPGPPLTRWKGWHNCPLPSTTPPRPPLRDGTQNMERVDRKAASRGQMPRKETNWVGVAFQAPPGSQASCRGEAKDSALLSSRDAGLWEPLERPQVPTQGSDPHLLSHLHWDRFFISSATWEAPVDNAHA